MARVVRIDIGALEEMERSLGRIQNAFAGENVESPEDRSEDIGPGDLVDKAKDYGEDCKKNYERQAEDLGALLQAITPVIDSFREADEKLGGSLTEGDKPAPPPHQVSV
ncbi:hypothetical protein NGM33_19675 [Nocardiopsis dassonvillei]|uniref:hypothetical protein n=1 Tax=Nocardiopsis dassonvillei TaxID=2014 RepID=UPI00102ABEC5|nr:hypothetical protein [Nocardiopsis dassonvillei]MCP3015549.1 hypothetical protein [Nocardiopsis dassonvillei]